ncbi:hypothetical protein BZA05DRAFT_401525 [Tricharina praecox]|uniref:uncharacterized protein n=1 Tax=Tricharina praecox TaxID=43433 RepID=UPI002220FF34|nr:uncharacterized protein BZA05DRAFT_401525 [Tricharina praecox]KAI5849778.1 hypothetical protein BZA05DRAFT_401525 [Tricharina praecox]
MPEASVLFFFHFLFLFPNRTGHARERAPAPAATEKTKIKKRIALHCGETNGQTNGSQFKSSQGRTDRHVLCCMYVRARTSPACLPAFLDLDLELEQPPGPRRKANIIGT